MLTRRERLEGGLIGMLVGDALGVPYEFYRQHQIPSLEQIEFDPPKNFKRSHQGTPSGTWSDDGAQALCLLASLQDCGKLDPNDLGQALVEWYDTGYMAVDGRVFDVGLQTARALRRMKAGIPPLEAADSGEQANGNGSLMRVLPLTLWHTGSDEALVADAHTQSKVTHAHIRSQICCALYCLWARRTLEESPAPWTDAVTTLVRIYGEASPEFAELEYYVRPDDPPYGEGGGYVVDCLRSARWAMNAGSYEAVVKAAVSLGNDTDTTACVAGGIAGVRDGIGAIPERWRNSLRGMEIVEPLLARLG
ncbi:MAG: ADP-ribosylglycohydrolase family protein [Blastocatellia bacterium]|nr:ADP-ribosylglycohydrolase family protein [Blastocatellia bacterium]